MNGDVKLFGKPLNVPPAATQEALPDNHEGAEAILRNYILEELPTDLRAMTEGEVGIDQLAVKHEAILAPIEIEVSRNADPHSAQSTQLDLLFMLGSYLPSGDEAFAIAPRPLMSMLTQNHHKFGIPERMDYASIIDFNVAEYNRTGQIRLYSDGEAANYERDFYVGHYESEPLVKAAYYRLRALTENAGLVDPTGYFEDALQQMNQFNKYMRAYHSLPDGDFSYFRQFLVSYPDGTRNASGAFMPSVQLMELALHKPTDEQEVFIRESMPYFPKWSIPVLQEQWQASEKGHNIEDQIKSGELTLSDDQLTILLGLIDSFIQFRSIHIGVTSKKLPDAFPPDKLISKSQIKSLSGERSILELDKNVKEGSANFNVQNVLGNSILRLYQLRDRLEA
jgi:hypothetical protein